MLKLTIICIKIFPAFAEDKKPYLSHLMPLKIVDFLWDQANVGIGVQVSSWGPTAWHLSLASGYSGQKGPVAARVPPCTLALALRMVNCVPGGRGPGSCCGVAMEPAHCCPPPHASLHHATSLAPAFLQGPKRRQPLGGGSRPPFGGKALGFGAAHLLLGTPREQRPGRCSFPRQPWDDPKQQWARRWAPPWRTWATS